MLLIDTHYIPRDRRLIQEVIATLNNTKVLIQYEKNWDLMRLHDPETITLNKGIGSLHKLTMLFEELEFVSLTKNLSAYTESKWLSTTT